MDAAFAPNLALALSGGGARAAYQVGFLRYLARRYPGCFPNILTGVSAGAINATYLASHPGSFKDAVDDLTRIWNDLTPGRVFRADLLSMAANFFRWGARLALGGSDLAPRTWGLLNTWPLRDLLDEVIPNENEVITGIQDNLQRGRLRAIGVTTTHYGTGQSITWTQGAVLDHWQRPLRRSCPTTLTVAHVMASAALPLVFPAVRIGDAWHGDGGIRLMAPLSPALHLGAERVIAVSTRYQRSLAEAMTPTAHGYPPPAQVIGILLNAMFLDMIDYDAMNLERINQLIETMPEAERGRLRKVEVLVLRPSRDLGQLAGQFESRLPRSVRFFVRGFGTRETSSPDALSFLMFEPEYLSTMIELGERDAAARAGDIEAFFTGSVVS